MSFQSFNQNYQKTRPLVDIKTGLLTVDGDYLLLALWNRTGMGTGIVPIVSPPLTATGGTQATALGLVADWNNVASVPSGGILGANGVVMPSMSPGNDITVFNGDAANTLNVYPFPGAQIDALGLNAPFLLLAGKLAYWQCWGTTQLRTANVFP